MKFRSIATTNYNLTPLPRSHGQSRDGAMIRIETDSTLMELDEDVATDRFQAHTQAMQLPWNECLTLQQQTLISSLLSLQSHGVNRTDEAAALRYTNYEALTCV